jgi:hypothetical protein
MAAGTVMPNISGVIPATATYLMEEVHSGFLVLSLLAWRMNCWFITAEG